MTPEESKRLSTLAMRFITASKSRWGDLVLIGVALSPKQFDGAAKRLSEQTGEGKQTIKRKFLAIQHAQESGLTDVQIIEAGQQKTLAQYVNGKVKARSAPLVAFPHRITPEVRNGLEELYQRIGRVVKCKTFDEATEYILSVFADLPDEELIHLAGESHPNGHKR